MERSQAPPRDLRAALASYKAGTRLGGDDAGAKALLAESLLAALASAVTVGRKADAVAVVGAMNALGPKYGANNPDSADEGEDERKEDDDVIEIFSQSQGDEIKVVEQPAIKPAGIRDEVLRLLHKLPEQNRYLIRVISGDMGDGEEVSPGAANATDPVDVSASTQDRRAARCAEDNGLPTFLLNRTPGAPSSFSYGMQNLIVRERASICVVMKFVSAVCLSSCACFYGASCIR
jgi:hypothetical protein